MAATFAAPTTTSVFVPLGDDGPRRRFPAATGALIAVNVGVFVVQMLLPGNERIRLLYAGGAVPFEISRFADVVDGALHPPALVPPPLTILTSLFLHGGIEHLVGNVWFLWVFGDNVEDAMGRARFLVFYLLIGVLACVAQVVMTPDSQVPIVGASGAIAGVLGAFFVLYPRTRVQMLLFLLVIVQLVVVPAFVALGVWFVWQVLSGRGQSSVAIGSHVGGFLIGGAFGKMFARRPDVAPRVAAGSEVRWPTVMPWTPPSPHPPNGPESSSSPP